MQETTNYKLKKLELTDSPADITVLNENWDKLDTEVKEHDSSLMSHAQSITEINEELEGINTELDTKYDKAGGTISGAVSIASGGLTVTGDSTFNDNVTVKGTTVHENPIRSSETNFLQTKVNVSRGTTPGSVLYSHWSVFDKDGYNVTQNRLAHIDYSVNNTGTSKLGLYVNKYVADNKEVPVGLFAMWTGETPQVMLTHTPPANSNDKSIATTDWVRALRATASEYGLIKLADEGDLLSEADEAALTVSGAYKLADFRRMSTAYALGDTVNCAFKSEYFLECTKAGTTSGGNLDTRNVAFGQVITDGTCRWTVRRHLKSINGQAPNEDGNISVDVDTDNLAKLNVENTFTKGQNFLLLNPALRLKNSGFTRGTTPDTAKYWTYGFLDKNGEITGRLLGYVNPDGDVGLQLGLCENTPEGPDTYHNMGVVVKADGTIYGYSPTPANTASGNEIITAEWANDNLTPKVVNTPVNDTDAANKSYVDNQISPRAVPTGCILPFMGQGGVPEGYLLCNGANVSRTTYANLFKAIGTKFGTGDGSTTFTLPNGNGRYMQGTTGKPGTAVAARLPNIQGWAAWPWMGQNNNGDYSGCFYYSQHGNEANNQGAYAGLTGLGFSASRSSSVYSGSSVTPASYGVQYLIKY